MGNSNKGKKHIWVLFIIIMSVALITGCSASNDKGDKPGNSNATEDSHDVDSKENEMSKADSVSPFVGEKLLSIDDQDVSYSELVLYLKYIQAYYENIFGTTIWDYNLGNKTIGELAKQDILDTIIERKIAKKQWYDLEVIVTEEDESNIIEESTEYMKNITEDDIKYYGITNEVVYQFFFDNFMAERVYDATTMDVDINVADEEARQITIQYLLVASKKTDNNGNKIPITEEEKQSAYARTQELLIEASNVEDFESFAKSNTESAEIERTFGKGEVEQVVEEAAFALKTDEISNIIESTEGYLILYCVDDYNEDATLAKKEAIIDERQREKFRQLFKDWEKKVKVEVNEEIWNQIEFE